MQFIVMLFEFLEASWLLLSLFSLCIGALYLVYKILKEVVFNPEHNWLSKLLHIFALIFVIIGGYLYWWYNYYLPVKPDTNYYEEEIKEESKVSTKPKKHHSVIDDLNAMAKESYGDPYEAGVKHLQK